MSSEQQAQDPLPHRVLANPRRQRVPSAHPRRPVVAAADPRDDVPERPAETAE
jgi:hypothetical protein